MPVKNNGPGGNGRASATRKSKVEPEYPQWAESKMRAIENRRLKELQAVVRDSMPEILAIVADEMDTASESIRKDGYSDMVRRIQNRFRIMRDRLSRRLKTDPLERDVRRCADYTDRRQLQEWQRSVRATLGIDISKDFFIGERYEQMLSRWAEQNVSFILLNQNISDVSAVKNTANAALPKESFTAKQIVALLSQYGLMSGCNADMLDGKHAAAFALSKHSHAASDITSGNLPIERGGTGAGTSADACRALGAMRNTGGTFTGTVYFANGTTHYVGSAGDAHFRSMTASEDIHAKRVFEAVYNDYAELMPRGEDTEPGDIIALDTNSQQEKYVKATNLSSRIAGIHSDEYGMLIGGEQVNDGEDFLEKNLPLFIPVSLAGRVHTKVIGPVNTGDCIVLSHIPGVGRAAKPCEYVDPCKVVGYAVEGDDLTEQRRLKVRVRGA